MSRVAWWQVNLKHTPDSYPHTCNLLYDISSYVRSRIRGLPFVNNRDGRHSRRVFFCLLLQHHGLPIWDFSFLRRALNKSPITVHKWHFHRCLGFKCACCVVTTHQGASSLSLFPPLGPLFSIQVTIFSSGFPHRSANAVFGVLLQPCRDA